MTLPTIYPEISRAINESTGCLCYTRPVGGSDLVITVGLVALIVGILGITYAAGWLMGNRRALAGLTWRRKR